MKAFSKFFKRKLVFLTTVVCMMVAGSISVLAVPKGQMFVTLNGQTLTGLCCSLWGDTIEVTEPAKVVPVFVTWSTEYKSSEPFYVGLSVNGGPCTAYGSRAIQAYVPQAVFSLRTLSLQWVIRPSDGLVQGANTLTVCGGAALHSNDELTIGIRTLAAEIGK